MDPSSGVCTHLQLVPNIDPTANFLYAANQDSDTIVKFRINKTTGKLAPPGQIVKVGSPVTIVFAAA
jgi:6-phosphogluconolactonase